MISSDSRCPLLARMAALVLGSCFCVQAQAAVLTQTRTTAATVTPAGTWTNPNNAASIDGACALGDGVTSSALTMTGWSFAIPAGSTILGITVRAVSSFNDVSTQDQISLTKAGSAVGTAKVLNGPGTQSLISCGTPIGGASGLTVGGPADLWGTTWTLAEINAVGFGAFYDNSFSNNATDGVEISVTFNDNTSTTVTINQAAGQADPTSTSPIDFTAVFSGSVTGFAGSDVSFAGSTAGGALAATVTGGPATYNVAVSGMTTSGTVVATIPAGAALDAGSNPTDASTSTDNTVSYIDPPPTVTINQAIGQADPTNAGPINFIAVFSEPVAGFAAADVSLAGSSAGGTLVVGVSGGPTTYNVAVSGMTTSGTVVASIPAAAALDLGGNPSAASTSTDNTVTFDNVPPAVTINQAIGQADPTNAGPINFTAVFSEPVSGFAAADVALAGSTAGGTLVVSVSGGPTTYGVAVSGMTSSGTIVANIGAGAANDAAGNSSLAATSSDNTVMFDITPPAVTINQAAGQADPTNTSPINFAVVFGEPVTGFAAGDVSVAGSTVGGSLVVAVTGSGANYNVAVSGMNGTGTVIATIPAGAAADAASNPSLASTSTDNVVLFDNVPPTVTVNQAPPQDDPTHTSPVHFTAVFSEPVTGFAAADVSLAGSTVGGVPTIAVTGGPAVYDVAVGGIAAPGIIVATIVAAAAVDSAGNASIASSSTDNSITYLGPLVIPALDAHVLAWLVLLVALAGVVRIRRRSLP